MGVCACTWICTYYKRLCIFPFMENMKNLITYMQLYDDKYPRFRQGLM